MKLWQLIFNLIFTVIGWISSAAALWQVDTDISQSSFFVFCFVISIISTVYVVFQCNLYISNKRQTFFHSTQNGVNRYLYNWIKDGGLTVIFTRDFTWANSCSNMLSMLEEKAKRHELIVCLYQPTATADNLKKLGAEIYIHGLCNLKSRFTIIHYGTNCPQITVGLRNPDGNYVNKRYSMQHDPHIYNVFVELFEAIKAACGTSSHAVSEYANKF